MTYQTHWMDFGGTCEPCPKCGTMLKWSNFYDVRVSKNVRHLKCPKKKCGHNGANVGQSKVRGVTPMERFNARAR